MIEDRTELEKEYFAYLLKERLPFPDGYYMENGRFYFSIPTSSNCKWDSESKTWIDLTTDLEKVKAQISEYSELDTPSTLKEMGTELANECMDLLIQLRNMAYTLGEQTIIQERDLPIFPKPSAKLKAFKDRFNSIK